MNNISLIFLALILVFLSSCSTDVDVNGEWDDIPIVYCVLDHSSQFQYVKVNKSFLGPVPASVMAQVSDSLFYENVSVEVKEFINNNQTRSWTFNPVDTIDKPDGYFSSDKNTIWVAHMSFTENATYELNVNINDGEHIIKGETQLIDGIYLIKPSLLQPQVEIHNYNGDSEYKYNNGTNGKVFQMTIVFNYIEIIDGDTSDNYISINWPQGKEYRSTSTASDVSGKFSVLAFYNLLASSIPPAEPNVKRLVKMPNSIEFKLAAADENYTTYMEVTAPSNGLVQDKPSFTNLSEGYGLFASRYNISLTKPLSGRSLDSINRGIYTKDLGFADRYDHYYTVWGVN
ncbi:MAG: hypothetical protein PHH30_06970 [Bacteroidales bacterium]|nr:hypothetical protein [Bacteroidales bacterium]MDD3859225.1 hypothetical protein [Bacteroidales bacterium]